MPPGVHHRAASVPDHFVVPLPRFSVDGLPDCTKTRTPLLEVSFVFSFKTNKKIMYFLLFEIISLLTLQAHVRLGEKKCRDPYVSCFRATGACVRVHICIPYDSVDACQHCCNP